MSHQSLKEEQTIYNYGLQVLLGPEFLALLL